MNSYYCEPTYPDVVYLRSMYPKSIFPIYEKITEAADTLEYEGSLMFDEYPDRELTLQFIQHIIANFPASEDPEGCSSWFEELVTVLTLNEFLHRRIRKKEHLMQVPSTTMSP